MRVSDHAIRQFTYRICATTRSPWRTIAWLWHNGSEATDDQLSTFYATRDDASEFRVNTFNHTPLLLIARRNWIVTVRSLTEVDRRRPDEFMGDSKRSR